MNTEIARANMVNGQLRPNKITNATLLERFKTVPREQFVSLEAQNYAYAEIAPLMKQGRTMLEPLVCAHLLQELNLQLSDNLLIVAGGTGYSAALCAPLVKCVTVVEEDVSLMDKSKTPFLDLDLSNIEYVIDSPSLGAQKNAPYDAILFDAPVAYVPQVIKKQLAPKGRIACVKPGADDVLEVTLMSKIGNTFIEKPLFETGGHIHHSFTAKEEFVF